jgi:hypothetical protein
MCPLQCEQNTVQDSRSIGKYELWNDVSWRKHSQIEEDAKVERVERMEIIEMNFKQPGSEGADRFHLSWN